MTKEWCTYLRRYSESSRGHNKKASSKMYFVFSFYFYICVFYSVPHILKQLYICRSMYVLWTSKYTCLGGCCVLMFLNLILGMTASKFGDSSLDDQVTLWWSYAISLFPFIYSISHMNYALKAQICVVSRLEYTVCTSQADGELYHVALLPGHTGLLTTHQTSCHFC